MKNKKIILGLLAVVLILGAGAGYYFWQKKQPSVVNIDQVFCTQEAKECPDGSYVGRTGSNCEFAQCPATSTEPAQNTTTSQPTVATSSSEKWLTYQNDQYQFEIDYPAGWDFIEMIDLVAFSKIGVAMKGSNGIYAFPITIKVYQNPQELSSSQWLEKRQKESGLVAEKISPVFVGGISGVKFSDKSIAGQDYTTYYAVKGNLLYETVYDLGIYSSEYWNIFEKMISSFKFLK